MRLLSVFTFIIATNLSAFQVSIDALSAIVVNPESGVVLFEKKADELRFPASLTKVATALYVLEKEGLDFTRVISPSEEALFYVNGDKKQANVTHYPPHRLEHNGVKLGIKPGKKIPLWAAFYGMLIKSGNDCSNAVAESFGKSIPDFVACMNAYLAEIGCQNTQFLNPHGLHHPMHRTTARDLALIATKALQLETFREAASSQGFFLEMEGEKKKKFAQSNKLIDPKSSFYYPYATGMKIGYTEKSGYSIIASAEKDARMLVAVVLGSPTSKVRYQETIKLFDAAFAEERVASLLIEKNRHFSKVWEKEGVRLQGTLKSDCIVEYYPSEKPKNLRAFVHWNDLHLPIARGDIVGHVQIFSAGKLLRKEALYAVHPVKMPLSMKLRNFWKRLFS